AVAQRLASEPIDAIVSSDLQRARVTAEAIARHHDLPVWEDSDLRETSLGIWEGFTYADVQAHEPELVGRWRTDPTIAPPGGETLMQVRDRAAHTLERWRTSYPAGTVLWSTHGGFLGVLICFLLEIDLNRRRQFRFGNTSITDIDLSRSYPVLLTLNEITHIRGLAVDDELDSTSTPVH
ncbi:MAG TPA: histidine phosphatase family protein, partial [Ktedonobacteraceae bacterium]|nr:histidine phosphatase family protein [Ktedonobacteraceae bacterium]